VLVEDLMTRTVATATPDASVREVARLMRDRDTGAVVVVAGDAPVGVITDRDLVVGALAEDASDDRGALACASSPVITVTVDADTAEAVRLMRRHDVRRLVVCRDGRVAGLVSTSDITLATDGATPWHGPAESSLGPRAGG
jgi:CBS domain-containing protein